MANSVRWESRIGRRLRLRDLHVFFEAVQSGSMARAAGQLGVSQPVVSEAIADLEATVGVRLLDRGPGGVVPTTYGQALLARGRIAFDELRQGIKDIEQLADPSTGEVRIGCPESLAAGVLPPIITELARRYPRVRFQVTQVNTLTTRLEFPELRERTLDVVLARVVKTFGEFEYQDDLRVEKLLDDDLLLVAGARSRWAGRRKIDLSELSDAPWILPANSWNSLRVEEAFEAVGLKMPDAIVDTFSLALRDELLATGRFIAAIPATTMNSVTRSTSLKVLPIRLPHKPWPVAIITLKNRTLCPAVQNFIECARHSAEALCSRGSR
jgi:DNA-binding transcriptional LysR family regulator